MDAKAMIRFLKIQENSGFANNDVDRMQTASAFAQADTGRSQARCCDVTAGEFSCHRQTRQTKSRDSEAATRGLPV
jgi:hypothetical protein